MFESILVANRGEIAVRVLTAAKTLGIRAIAVFSDADHDALHVRIADEAWRIGNAPARESYLDITAMLGAARAAGAKAVHPGYGLLSENADFARAVGDAGLAFIGSPPTVIAQMGDKLAARAAAMDAGLPVLLGSGGPIEDLEEAWKIADEIGYPVVVKACFGGGGRGMRVVERPADLEAAIGAAAREADAAFGRPELFLEHFLTHPRHVEVQIVADDHGAVVHLGDRDCTVQRRQQKLIEEAPAPDLAPALRSAMHEAAVTLCRRVGYRGAGTVEFLVEATGARFFFLEMNTRLQVEHGVTELVTGIDIVETQIAIAAGQPLPFGQADIALRGHAIEARLIAEDAASGFMPTPGRIALLDVPQGPWLRADLGVAAGDRVEPYYDSMFGKLLAWGQDRESARRRLGRGLRAFRINGVSSTAPYLAGLLDEPDFRAMRHFTGSVERDWAARGNISSPAAPCEATYSTGRTIRLPGVRPIEIRIHGGALAPMPRMANDDATSTSFPDRAPMASGTNDGSVVAPMDAVVVAVAVAAGARVTQGDNLLTLEAMKMEVAVTAPRTGLIRSILVTPGIAIGRGTVLVELEP